MRQVDPQLVVNTATEGICFEHTVVQQQQQQQHLTLTLRSLLLFSMRPSVSSGMWWFTNTISLPAADISTATANTEAHTHLVIVVLALTQTLWSWALHTAFQKSLRLLSSTSRFNED